MRPFQCKTINIVIFIVLCAVCGYNARPAFAFYSEIEIDRQNLVTIEEFVLKKPAPVLQDLIKTCVVKAGKTAGADSILVLGQLIATEADLEDANEIVVTIDGNDMNEPYKVNFPIDSTSFKKGKYNYARKENASKKLFKFDGKTKKFTFMAKNIDLTGLSCPVSVKIEIGDYLAEMEADEDIVNGPKKPIPIELMMGVKNILRVDKFKVKFGKTDSSDSLSITGAFTTVTGEPNKAESVVIVLGGQVFTIPGDKFSSSGSAEACKTTADEGASVVAKFDFAKCAFSINITRANITEYGEVDFGIDIFGIHTLSTEKVNLGPKRIYGLEELRQYDALGVEWDYNADYSYKLNALGQKLTDSNSVNGTVSVYGSLVSFNGESCYEVTSSVDSDVSSLSNYWYSGTDGIHCAGFELGIPGTFDLEYTVDSDLVFPDSLVIGRAYTDSGPFMGNIYLDTSSYGVDFDFTDFQGTASHSIVLTGSQQISVPYGTFEAVKGKYTRVAKGKFRVTIDIYSYGIHYEGKGSFTSTIKQNFWAVPDLGFAVVDSKVQMKLSMSKIGSISAIMTEHDALTDYSD